MQKWESGGRVKNQTLSFAKGGAYVEKIDNKKHESGCKFALPTLQKCGSGGRVKKTGPKFRKGGGDVEKVKKRMNHAPWQKYVRVVEEIRAQASS